MLRCLRLLVFLIPCLQVSASLGQVRGDLVDKPAMAMATESIHSSADVLLAIDPHRVTVIDRIVAQCGDALAQSSVRLDRNQSARDAVWLAGLRINSIRSTSRFQTG